MPTPKPSSTQVLTPSGKVADGESNFRVSVIICLYMWVAAVVSNAAGRVALAVHQAQFGHEPIAFCATGLAIDSADWIVLFFAVNMIVAAVVRVVFRKRFASFVMSLRVTIIPTTFVLFVITMLGSVWASEHKIERGLYPTLLEFSSSLDKDFALAGVRVFALERFRYTPVIGALLLLIASVGVYRNLGKYRVKTVRLILYTGLNVVVVALFCYGVSVLSTGLVPSIPGWNAIGSPARTFFRHSEKRKTVRHGAISLFHRLELPDSMLASGAELLGYSGASAEALMSVKNASVPNCHPHPLATGFASQVPMASSAHDSVLLESIQRLSHALFDGRSGPVCVWLISLESVRGDDVHALHERAPRQIVPYINSLYEQAQAPDSNVITAKYMFQGGIRTSQALASMMCGLGTIPFGLSASRDLGLVPFRCLPDVLKDADFRLAYYYGSNPTFDNMLEFLNYHGFHYLVTGKKYRQEASFSGWGVLDHAVFMQALEDSQKAPKDKSQFNFLMSLTNHFPFQTPTDLPKDVKERVTTAVSVRKVRSDDVARLYTVAYTDWVLQEFIDRLQRAPEAKYSIVFVVGDHTTTDYYLWREGEQSRDFRMAMTRIPFAVILPPALIESSGDPDQVRRIVATLNEHLHANVISQNDVPLFVLNTLMQSVQLEGLSESWRWHTIGAQRLSSSFQIANHRDAVVLGVDSRAKVFVVSRGGQVTQLNEDAATTVSVKEAMGQSATLLPAASVLSVLMGGYASHCWEARTIRKVP